MNNTFLRGVAIGFTGCMFWRLFLNNPVYLRNIRFHHYTIGLILLGYGLNKKNSEIIGLGLYLIIDDFPDLVRDLNKIKKLLQDILTQI